MIENTTKLTQLPIGPLASVMLLATSLGLAHAQIERQHGAHVHGEATGALAIDGQTLTLQLDFPGFNLVGFEHAPRDENQRQALDRAIDVLARGQWLVADPQAQCGPSDVALTPVGFGAEVLGGHHNGDDHHHNHSHSHSHSHNHSHNHDHDHDHNHARFEINATMECANVSAMRWLEMDVFGAFPNNEKVVVDVLTETNVFQATLTPNRTKIQWR